MHLLEMEARAHDLHAAYISHIPTLPLCPRQYGVEKEKGRAVLYLNVASAGFESTVRLAKSNPRYVGTHLYTEQGECAGCIK